MTPAAERDFEREVSRTVEQVLAFQAGDDHVLQDLFRRYYPRVLQIVRARMGPKLRQREWSSDLVSLTFLAASRELREARLHGPGALIHWLATLAENAIRGRADYWKVREVEVELEALSRCVSNGEFQVEPEAPHPSPLETAAGRERLRAALECMQDLSDDQREVLLLRKVGGCDMHYVTARMNRSADAVSQLTARAEAKLLELMLERGHEFPESESGG